MRTRCGDATRYAPHYHRNDEYARMLRTRCRFVSLRAASGYGRFNIFEIQQEMVCWAFVCLRKGEIYFLAILSSTRKTWEFAIIEYQLIPYVAKGSDKTNWTLVNTLLPNFEIDTINFDWDINHSLIKELIGSNWFPRKGKPMLIFFANSINDSFTAIWQAH